MHSSTVIYQKEAVGVEAMDRLRAESVVLQLVAHPNVVELVGGRFSAEEGALRLVSIQGAPLVECELEPNELASVILTTAVTLAHIHSLDVAHGAINAKHIMVRNDRRTSVLCGFSKATVDADFNQKEVDVINLGTVLRNGLPKTADALRSRINGVPLNRELILKLESLADLATAGETSAEELAERIRSVVESGTETPRTHIRLSRWLAVAALIPLALIVFAFSALSSSHGEAAATPSTTVVRVAPCPSIPRSSLAIDTDGDGCPNDVTISGAAVVIDGEHYAVGNLHDKLIVGDWYGTGASTLALLRPSTGQLFVFDGWPSAGQSATPALLTKVDGATDVAVLRDARHDTFAIDTPHGDVPFDATTAKRPTP